MNEKLIALFQAVMLDILEDVDSIDDIMNDKKKKRLFTSIVSRLNELGATVQTIIPQWLVDEYNAGYTDAVASLEESGIEKPVGDLQARMHLEAVQNLVDDTGNDLMATIRTATVIGLTEIDDLIDEVSTKIGEGLTRGQASKRITAEVKKHFANHGLTGFITRDGKRLPLDFYASTVVRTKSKVANATGQINRYNENGIKLIYIEKHSPSCVVCARRQGLVVSLTGEHEGVPTIDEIGGLPPYHPNCRCSFRPIAHEDNHNYPIRRFDPERDPRSDSQKKAYKSEQAIRQKANAEKKMYNRMRAEGVEGLPATLGAFRRIKRANNTKWKQLQEDYRTSVRTATITRQREFSERLPADTDFINEQREQREKGKGFEPTKTKIYKDMVKNLNKGTKLTDLVDMDVEEYDAFREKHGDFIEPNFYMWEKEGVEQFFGADATMEGVANVFNPDPSKFTTRFRQLRINEGQVKLDVEFKDKKGNVVGNVNREIIERNGKWFVINHLLEIKKEYQGNNIATELYFKSEQFYKMMAKGKPIVISTLANLDVGVYAWTRHGFDFKDEDDMLSARSNVERLINDSLAQRLKDGEFGELNVDITRDQWKEMKPKLFTEELRKMGYEKLTDIVHSWQFASLDNGTQYELNGGNGAVTHGHLGKYLFLNLMGSWDGRKRLNSDDVTEEISNMYYESKGIE